MDARAEKIALFRYALIAPLVLEVLPRGELTRRAEEIAARKYEVPYSERTSLSVDTLLDWALRYRRGGFPALAPKPRCDRGQPRVVPPQLAELIERLKRENPHRTGMTLLRERARGVRYRLSRHLGRHPVALPQTARLDYPPVADRASAQEVRSRTK